MAPALRTLALRHDVLCIEVVDPVELALPNVGMLVLHDTLDAWHQALPNA